MQSDFSNAVTGRVAAIAVGAAAILMGIGGNAYSQFYAHGSGSEEGLKRRVDFCHRDYQGCATDRQQLESCMLEKSILGQTARVNSYILFIMGLMILSAAAVSGGKRDPESAKPSNPTPPM